MLPTKFTLLVSVAGVLALSLAVSAKSYPGGTGNGKTTRYWDCCKTSCAWSANTGAVTSPVNTCPNSGLGSISKDAQSGCNGGDAYVCNDQQPFVHEGQLYAFAAGNVNGLPMSQMCCACYKFTFTNTAMAGKNLIVQVINTGNDLGSNHFDIQIPGGGMGIFTAGCAKQWPGTPANKWGQQYGGVSSKGECAGLPAPLRKGCEWRFDHFKNADNPLMKFERVPCPAVLVAKSKCKRQDD